MSVINHFIRLLILSVVLLGCRTGALKTVDEAPVTETKKAFKVIGYMFADGDLLARSADIDFRKITHLNIAFLNPDKAGNFASAKGLSDLVKKAHASNVKVIAAFGGGNPPPHLKDLLIPANRHLLVDGLIQLIKTYDLDGLDVDLEGDFVNENYESFVVDLSAALKKEGKLMTAAVATWNSAAYSDQSLSLFDLINVMSYDHTGPWRKDHPGPHASFEDMETDFNHWNKDRSIASEKLILGLPFYAYGFGPNISESMNFGDLVAAYTGSEKTDSLALANKGTFYYNGLPTIKRKVAFALQKKAGGVMVWQLLGDAPGKLSLLTAIHNAILIK
ncbi:MAG: glycosyl hydrolase family 18 protein [Sphingobacteriaceae bacterium]